jgi:phosphohistidine swiveling domain-containing protein
MADENLAELLKTQKSLTEWLEDIKHRDVDSIRREDNDKRERLRILSDIIGLPYDKPVQFEASELTEDSPKFVEYLKLHGEDLCALRLLPKDDGLAKLRMRGKSVKFAYDWFKQQKINPIQYRADFVPHPPDYGWSTIFVVNHHGICGEIIFGGHHLLTQGFHTTSPLLFNFNFQDWFLSEDNADALVHLKKLANYLLVGEESLRKQVTDKLNGKFHNNYLSGYFESTDSSVGTWFIDYNRILGETFKDVNIDAAPLVTKSKGHLSGRSGSHGQAEGKVRIVHPEKIDAEFQPGEVLVCVMTTPQHVPLMKRAAAIITDQGGILCHAAIVARELGIPCIVGTNNATSILADGDKVSVNATNGTVSIIN